MNSTSNNSGIAVRDEDGIRTITFDRADKKNAITEAMWVDLGAAFATAASDGNCVVLITGAGGSFTAGNDLSDFLEHPPQNEDAAVFRCLLALAALELPLIAAVRGPAVGVGTTLLLHCDLVFASPTAKFKVPFVDLGVVPENASSILMPQ
ncbi:MAG TPA: enoyl-CoA hydratase-related protein, partial [Rhodocyclaceae bacterium]|nr:enoyl-CoA hydratase-related protein [Rhodocyclaceae bacterium]